MREITARQLEYLQFIAVYTREHGYAPATRDMQAALGVASTNAVHCALRSLEAKGMIIHSPKLSRSIRLTADGRYVVEEDDGLAEATMAAQDAAKDAPGDAMAVQMARWLRELQERRGRAA